MKNKLEALNTKKSECQIEIIHSFNDLISALNIRKIKLLKQLDDITDQQSEHIKSMINAREKPLETIKQIQKETNELINEPIDISEIPDRKSKVIENEKNMAQVAQQFLNQSLSMNDHNHLTISIDTDGALQVMWFS